MPDAAQLRAEHLATGVVYRANGRPAAGICVVAVGAAGTAFGRTASGETAVAMTAVDGRYSMVLPTSGSYVLRYHACRSGAIAATRIVVMTAAPPTGVPAVTLPPTRPQAQRRAAGTFAAALAAEGVSVPRRPSVRAAASAQRGRSAGGIDGKVTSPSGSALRDICVSVIGQGMIADTATSKNGTYSISARSLPAGRYPVEFASTCSRPLADGPWAPQWYRDTFSESTATTVLLKPGHVVRHIDAVMQRQGVVTGTVTGARGRGLGGVCAVLTTARGVEVAHVTTRGSGRYRMTGLDPGRYRLLFLTQQAGCKAADYASAWWPAASSRSGARPVRVRLGQVTGGINARMAQLGTITGTVRLRSSAGRPLRGMCVSAVSPDPVLSGGFASTRRNGTYVIRALPAGRYQIVVDAGCRNNGNYASASYPGVTSVPAGATVRGINSYLQPGGTASGTVTDAATGKPLRGICVADDNGDVGFTKRNGTYRLDRLVAGKMTMSFSGGCGNGGSYAPQWSAGQDNPASARTLTIRAGREAAGIDAAMLPGATIAGNVTWPGGTRAAGVCVSAVDRYDLGLQPGDLGGNVITGRTGRYSIANLAPDDYAIAFFGGCGSGTSDAAQQWYPGQPTDATAGLVSAVAGETVRAINAVVTPGGYISGVVTDAAGRPVQFECVYALSSRTGLAGGDDAFGSDGSYTIAGLAPGRYHVEAADCGGGSLADARYRSPVTVRAGRTASHVNLALPEGGSVTGKVTVRGTGSPARSVCVRAGNSDPVGARYATTSGNGRYRISGLAAGSYRIAVITTYGCEPGGELLAPVALSGRVRVAAGRTTGGVNGSVGPGGAVAGVVTGPGEHAEPGMCAEVFARSGGLVSYTATGGDGRYQIAGLAPGRYDVLLGNPSCSYGPHGLASQWYRGAASRSAATVVAVTAGRVRAGVNATIGRSGTISGSVRGAGSAQLTGICIRAVPVGVKDRALYTTSGHGRYTLAQLPPGRYRVEFRSGCGLTGFKAQWWDGARSAAGATVVTVRSGTVVSDISAVMTARPAGASTG